MILKGVRFDNVCVASGVLNFFGQGWKHHKVYKVSFPGMFNFSGATFIAKTTTLNARVGNMALDENYMNRDWFPDCIIGDFKKQIVLNSVGLSGPGVEELLSKKVWQNMTKPFFISFMSLGNTREEKLAEARAFVEIMKKERFFFKAPFGIQVNVSCPNTEHPTTDMIADALAILQIIYELGVPVDLKIGVADSTLEFLHEVQSSKLCDCITCSNTIRWGQMSERIDWEGLFGTTESPLKKEYGGGGLSGAPLLPIVTDWLDGARRSGIDMPLKVGGGILCKHDVDKFLLADGIEIGCVSILAPWRVRGIIKYANNIFGGYNG